MQSQTLSLATAADIANAWRQNPKGEWVQVQPAVALAAQMYNTTHEKVTQAMAADAAAQSRSGCVKYNVRGPTQHTTARAWQSPQHKEDAYRRAYGGGNQWSGTSPEEVMAHIFRAQAEAAMRKNRK